MILIAYTNEVNDCCLHTIPNEPNSTKNQVKTLAAKYDAHYNVYMGE